MNLLCLAAVTLPDWCFVALVFLALAGSLALLEGFIDWHHRSVRLRRLTQGDFASGKTYNVPPAADSRALADIAVDTGIQTEGTPPNVRIKPMQVGRCRKCGSKSAYGKAGLCIDCESYHAK